MVGLALLTAVKADVTSLRIALTAPVLGTAAMVLPLFVFSHAGVAMEDAAVPVILLLVVASVVVLAFRRPRLPIAVAPVIGLCIVNLLLVGRPMFEFGFDWIANANDDMANYVLSATKLLTSGLLEALDVGALTHDRGYGSALQPLHSVGARPGADIMLAGFAEITGRPPYEIFMPMILALHLCAICAVAALAMQGARKWWVASLAATLFAISPLASYGVLQQLLPQVWGLGLVAALYALLLRGELHSRPGPRLRDVVPIGLLTVAIAVVYIELASTIVIVYGLYLAVLLFRRELALRPVLRLWIPVAATALIGLNTYLIREIEFVQLQASGSFRGSGSTPLFGYSLVPAALPGIFGLRQIAAGPESAFLEVSIVVAAVLLAAALMASLATARSGVAAAIALTAYAGLGAMLMANSADFGLFKLYMFVQPFLAAAAAIWIGAISRKRLLVIAAVGLAPLMAVGLHTQHAYVEQSRNPIDLRHASSPDLLPAFRRFFGRTDEPVLSAAENPTLAKMEAASVGERALYLLSRNVVRELLTAGGQLHSPRLKRAVAQTRRLDGWRPRSFELPGGVGHVNRFSENTHATRILLAGRCRIVLPTGTQLPLNRLSLPEGSPDLADQRCADARNTLVFTISRLGQSFYLPEFRRAVSFYQLERDFFYEGRTVAGFGRYALFRAVGTTGLVRMELDITKTLRRDRTNMLPPAAAVGERRERFSLVGRGSARVYSPPLRPQIIGGQAYVMLDIGEHARILPVTRSGIAGIYGRSIPLDPRYLTSYVRDVSLISERDYDDLEAPRALRRFPADLANPALEYSGMYEDGWIGERSYAMLDSGRSRNLVVRADVLPRPGQHLDLFVDGRRVFSRNVEPGALDLRLPLPASDSRRRVELRWAGAVPLGPRDRRPASARLRFLGFAPSPAQVNVPADLNQPGLISTGIYPDGWADRVSAATLSDGPATYLDIRAQVLPSEGQRLLVRVNDREVLRQAAPAGNLDVRVPLEASNEPRRVELRWRDTVPLAAPDKRRAAARLTFLGLVDPPSAVLVPESLSDPGLVSSGIDRDGWLAKSSFAVLAGGQAANLVLRANIPEIVGQRLIVRIGRRTLSSTSTAPGRLDLRLPVPASTSTRRIELRWARTTALQPPDPRRAAARLELLSVAPTRALSEVQPDDLSKPTTDYSGIYRDGWLEQDARVLLAGGPAGKLTLRGQTNVEGQRLRLVVNGRTVTSKGFQPGQIELEASIPASKTARTVELRWAKTEQIAANDRRQAAALLQSIGVVAARTPSSIESDDLAGSGLDYSGIYRDGWLEQDARVLLAGGPAGKLTLRGQTNVEGQRLRLVVNGRTITSKGFQPGQIELEASIPASKTARTVELRWAKTEQIAANDRRQAAALLQSIAITVSPGSPRPVARPPVSPRAEGSIRASLTVSQEVPAPVAATLGRGTFTGTVENGQLRWRLTVSRLTGPVVAAVIRVGPRGQIGERLLYLCSPCASPASGTVILSDDQAATLRNAETYVNVGTSTNPFGEIRGQINRG